MLGHNNESNEFSHMVSVRHWFKIIYCDVFRLMVVSYILTHRHTLRHTHTDIHIDPAGWHGN